MAKNYAKLVNVHMGGVAHLTQQATYPLLTYPHGMLQTFPVVNLDMPDKYLGDRIYGFPAGPAAIMPVGDKKISDFNDLACRFDHDLEEARPYIYKVWLQDIDTNLAYSVARHAGVIKIDFPSDNGGDFILYVPNAKSLEVRDGKIFAVGTYNYATAYAVYEFDGVSSFDEISLDVPNIGNVTMDRIIAVVPGKAVRISAKNSAAIRFGVSLIDSAQAEDNLAREIPAFDLDSVAKASMDEWNRLLGRIRVQGNPQDEELFYSALYRASVRMLCYSEYGRYYSGFDNRVHDDDGHEFYCDDGVWDTFRSQHPLQLIIEPKVHADVCESYLRMHEQCGFLPSFPYQDGPHAVMLGCHVSSVLANALAHGVPLDPKRVYKAVRPMHTEMSLIPWYNGPSTELDKCYYDNGFFPALGEGEVETCHQVHSFERRQCIAVTLEQSYDDWCASKIAALAGEAEDAALFEKRAYNYKNLFNKERGFMWPKTADGKFMENFDPKYAGGQGARDYFAENNTWTYSLNVQHDIEGLARLYGGREQLDAYMDQMFVEQYDGRLKFSFLNQFPDSTGLMGQFNMGNEPCFHIPYIYNFLGKPWKTQRHIREIVRMWFHSHPYGICGDEDCGAMTSWFVFTSIGLYPFCPGNPYYTITSPLFDKVEVDLPSGKTLVIRADGASGKAKYISGASLNGAVHGASYIRYEDIKDGAELVLEVCEKPDFEWGTDVSQLPPSFTEI